MKIGIVGCGTMGKGIAQLAAQSNYEVLLYGKSSQSDQNSHVSKVSLVKEQLEQTFTMLESKGKMSAATAASSKSNLHLVYLQELSECDLVIESITENLNEKVKVLNLIESVVKTDCVIASNTSSFSITELGSKLIHQERFAGLHFFNPAPLMKVIELVEGLETSKSTLTLLREVGLRLGHSVVDVKDSPGFIVNHVGRAYVTEGLKILSESTAPFYEIDRILRDTAGFKLGPFELLDLMGLDTSHPVMESIYHQFYEDRRYLPQPVTKQRLSANILGKKTQQGFYEYSSEVNVEFKELLPDPNCWVPSVWVPQTPRAILDLTVSDLIVSLGGTLGLHRDGIIVITPELGEDVTTAATRQGISSLHQTIGLDLWQPCIDGKRKRFVLMTNPLTSRKTVEQAVVLFSAGGNVSVIRDSVGFITQRVVAMIINLACEVAQQGIASPLDIDLSVKVALGYPHGPLTWGDLLGPRNVLKILEGLESYYKDPRYRPSAWLKRRAQLGTSLLTEEL